MGNDSHQDLELLSLANYKRTEFLFNLMFGPFNILPQNFRNDSVLPSESNFAIWKNPQNFEFSTHLVVPIQSIEKAWLKLDSWTTCRGHVNLRISHLHQTLMVSLHRLHKVLDCIQCPLCQTVLGSGGGSQCNYYTSRTVAITITVENLVKSPFLVE